MARRRTKRSVDRQAARSRKNRQTHKKRKSRKSHKTRSTYRHGLIEAIGKWFPGQFFSRWSVTAGVRWSPQRLFWMAILMAWSAEQTLEGRFDATWDVLRSLFPKWPLGKTYTGWYEAQLKWIEPLQPALKKRLRQQIEAQAGRHWLREGWCAFAVDGSRVECPRTLSNEEELKRAGREKTGPQLFVTTVLHMGTGLPWDFRIGPGTASERRHLEEMAPDLPKNALVVADAGFTGYDLYRRLLKGDRNFLIRVGSNVHLLRELGYYEFEGPDLVYLWPERNWQEPPVELRLIVRREGKKTMHLVTNVLDRKLLSNRSVGILYEMRWGVEVFYRSFKQTLAKKKMLSHSPAAARCELTWALFGMWLLQCLSVGGILSRKADPLRWSAARARNRVRKSIRKALKGRCQDRQLAKDLAQMLKDDYKRLGSKKARAWPHKKKEKPPGSPKIQSANAEQKRAVKRLKKKQSLE
jgi:Transposase DDE domain